MPYIGKSPSAGVRQRYQYTATAGQTTFSGTDLGNLTLTYTDNNFVDVFQNGVLLKGGGTDYTATSGTSVVLATGASVSDVIEIIVYDVFSVGNFFNRTDSDSRYVNVDGDTMTGTLALNVSGSSHLTTTTSGTSNFVLGVNAGNSIASGGNYNVALGDEAGTAITTADDNVVIGYQAGDALTTGGLNTFVGSNAGSATDDGASNTAVGAFTLDAGNCGNNNTAIGAGALGDSSHTGSGNTAVGKDAGNAITTGDNNTIIGGFNGNEDGFDIRTLEGNIVFSDGEGKVRGLWEGGITYPAWKFMSNTNAQFAMVIQSQHASNPYGIYMQFTGASPDNNVHNFLTCADNSTSRLVIYSDGDVVNHDNSYGAISDIKLKEQIADASSQWDDVKALKVRKFKMKEDVSAKGDSDALWRLGVVAQELETAGMNGLVETNSDIDIETKKDLGTTTKSVKYSVLYMKAVKALQEAMTRIETLESEVAKLKE